MPLYEYECDACHHRFERIQKFSDPLVDVCPNCGKGPVKKLLSSPAIQFKGSGWYVTDYARKSSKESSGKTSTGDSSSTTTPSTPAASDTGSKPAEKSETKS
ncbi:MAG TPA: zinc ribbon domain-containing protein [Sphingomicrobium sp.]|jgi:putative FmdB family regulatory protein